MGKRQYIQLRFQNLHSNMVLLQLVEGNKLSFLYRFTFQYGSTSMIQSYSKKKQGLYLHSNMVLLQSKSEKSCQDAKLNLHSNMVLLQFFFLSAIVVIHLIYIPIWFYFNQIFRDLHSTLLNLHSNMVLLQCKAL